MTIPTASSSRASSTGLLETRAVEKVWGREVLPEPFETQVRRTVAKGEAVGEVWFDSPPELEEILVKYLFTNDKLSVQVHPSDEQARHSEHGKEECWLILDAEPDAQLAIGFTQTLSAETVEAAARDGSIEQLLEWHDVAAGDFFYLPAGTVHAIGAGISLVEVQQSSDTTFRMYDYGRPRELHLDRAIAVADRGPYSEQYKSRVDGTTSTLVRGPHFQLSRLAGAPDKGVLEQFARPCLVLPLSGVVHLEEIQVPAGSCATAQDLALFQFSEDAIALLVSNAGQS